MRLPCTCSRDGQQVSVQAHKVATRTAIIAYPEFLHAGALKAGSMPHLTLFHQLCKVEEDAPAKVWRCG
jgi:hypothetical protein